MIALATLVLEMLRHGRCLALTVAVGAAAPGCAEHVHSAFHSTDPTFTPRAGQIPGVYLARANVPNVDMHSVGILEVMVPARSGIERAVEVAVTKGRELGCWALIEHSVFVEVSRTTWNSFGARTILVHGGAPHVAGALHAQRPLTTKFDCVVRGDRLRVVDSIVGPAARSAR